MTLFLSVTPHVEPTHTQWDREGGTRLPYRYGIATRAEREAATRPMDPPAVLLERHLAASEALADAARANAAAQASAADELRAALASGDAAAVHAAVTTMWEAFSALHSHLRASERVWNDLAPIAGD